MRAGAVLKLVLALAAVAAVAVVAVVKSIDVQGYRRLIAEAVTAQTGREVGFGGDFRLAMSLRPRLVATDVTLANAAGGSRAHMLRVGRVEAEIALLPLLRREVEVRRLALSGVDLLLERDAKGRPNWEFSGTPAAIPAGGDGIPHTSIGLDRVGIEKMTVGFRDARDGTLDGAIVDSVKIDAEAGPLAFTAAGSFEHRRFDVSGVTGSMAELLRQARPFPVRLNITIGAMAATVDGSVARPLAGDGLDLRLAIEGSEIAEAGKLLRRHLPALGPFRGIARVLGSIEAPRLVNVDAAVGKRDTVRLTARGDVKLPLAPRSLTLALSAEADDAGAAGRAFGFDLPAAQPLRAVAQLASTADGYRLADLRATIGGSDVNGQVHVVTGGKWPILSATLASRRVGLADLGLKRIADPVAKAPGALMFPDEPLALGRFGGVELDLAWRADEVVAFGLSMHQAVGRLAVHDGFLRLEPVSARLAEGRVLAGITVDGTGQEPVLALVLDAQRVEFGKVLSALGVTRAMSGGRGDFRANVGGTGASMRTILADLSGEMSLVVDDGAIDNASFDTYSFDRLRQIAPWTPRAEATILNCLVSRLDIRAGRAASRAFLLDTSHVTMAGDLVLDLKEQSVRATLVPRAKKVGLISVANPIEISGSLTNPDVAQRDKLSATAEYGGIVLPLVVPVDAGQNACVVALHNVKSPASSPVQPPPLPEGGALTGTIGKSR